MPYVTQKERDVLDPFIQQLFDLCEQFKGRINYCITKLTHLWALKQMEKVKSLVKKYYILNDAYGIMCSAVAEFYSAVVVPYEKLKRRENGSISQLDSHINGANVKYYCHDCKRIFNTVRTFPKKNNAPGCYHTCQWCDSTNFENMEI